MMRIKDNYVLQQINDEYLVVPIAEEADRLHGLIKLNDVGAFIWKMLQQGVSSVDELETALKKEFEIDDNVIHDDVSQFLSQLVEMECLERIGDDA